MRLFVTGGSGYLGAALLHYAPATWQSAATYWNHPIDRPGRDAIHLDIRDPQAVDQALREFRPDVVIHTAALMTGPAMNETNVHGSLNVARSAARLSARLIHLSSDVIFDGEHAPYDEASLPTPITPYASSKVLSEEAVKSECPAALIVRTSLIYGFAPVDPRTRQTLNGEMPNLFSDEYRCPILVDDLALALIELATRNERGVLNVAGPQRLSRYEFGVKLADSFRVAPKFRPTLSGSSPTRRPRDCTLDVSRAQAILRTRLQSVDQALAHVRAQ